MDNDRNGKEKNRDGKIKKLELVHTVWMSFASVMAKIHISSIGIRKHDRRCLFYAPITGNDAEAWDIPRWQSPKAE
ncbi:MAG: hypothetical protein A3J10_02925 [Candidatus Sungbacteria bacterium RIFCSPLOWO2_02_FULL_54_10]|uniref:Uncharacterized protein n=1 Tax=Candidatus Sungbacteria bacterium RIFCSPHIGHO2_02_FULL_53_17 TaxID=1802275 RepID=A0A1G2KT10_9BACT|nr:MAG: hypothetical protein A3C92_02830 [Candidatus Sungbacteria bacterium RIFCSPHIGHO2_02_FULL_53_17]OHA13510.1 MAG: hypothetical protein A3J10_02925 [Candidatus Sungbacteria bacterium RIFCSPLOWO2_02_FULL_54_10]